MDYAPCCPCIFRHGGLALRRPLEFLFSLCAFSLSYFFLGPGGLVLRRPLDFLLSLCAWFYCFILGLTELLKIVNLFFEQFLWFFVYQIIWAGPKNVFPFVFLSELLKAASSFPSLFLEASTWAELIQQPYLPSSVLLQLPYPTDIPSLTVTFSLSSMFELLRKRYF